MSGKMNFTPGHDHTPQCFDGDGKMVCGLIKISHDDHVEARSLLSAIEIPLAEYIAARKAVNAGTIVYMKADEIIARELAFKARDLMDGMLSRVKRSPDVADFAAAFEPIIRKFAK